MTEMEKKLKTLYIVIPCYNEEEVLEETARRLKEKLTGLIEREMISPESKAVFVNDGSKDGTWEIISSLYRQDLLFGGVNLSRNRGHQNALLAGLTVAVEHADAIITMDADLQDDINAIDEMMKKYSQGYEVVYGVRSSRKKDTFFKKFTAESYYKALKVLGADIVYNHADYRLLSKRAVQGLLQYKEVNLFLRGIKTYSKIGSVGVCSQCHHVFVEYRPVFGRTYSGRMVFADGVYVVFRRRSACVPGSNRGVCGKDIWGNQAQASIYY